MAEVVVEGGDEASYFATMVATLLAQNVERTPGKYADFRALEADVVIEVQDIGQTLTLSFAGGRCVVRDGVHGRPRLRLRTDSETFNQLGLLRIGPLGIPVYTDVNGRAVVRAMARGRLRIRGLHHLRTLNRVTRLFSVV